MGCGIKRLFDEHSFQAYGPFSYDLSRLVAWDLAQVAKTAQDEPHSVMHRPAS
jgi:hypothetical protein